MNREAKRVDRELTDMGFVLVRAKRHLVYHHPKGGEPVTAPKSASDHRASRNVLAKAKRVVRDLESAA